MSEAMYDADSAAGADLRSNLREIGDFGDNPADLRMHVFVPPRVTRPLPLVVVLHGCRQTAEGYDAASGWSRLAAEAGFIVLYPEQRRANNHDMCFRWFDAAQVQRGGGEVASVRQMVAAAVDRLGADPARIYANGLSAGGAMAGAMLATYPEVFAGGAIIAGLPHGIAANLSEARQAMAGRTRDAKAWGDLVRAASAHTGTWPRVAVWHGTADPVVNPVNAGEIVKQWTNVHGVSAAVPAEDHVGKVIRRTWRNGKGCPCVVEYSVPDLGHGAPVDDRDPPAPFFLPAGVSSTRLIARDWGLADPSADPGRAGTGKRRRFWSRFGL